MNDTTLILKYSDNCDYKAGTKKVIEMEGVLGQGGRCTLRQKKMVPNEQYFTVSFKYAPSDPENINTIVCVNASDCLILSDEKSI